MELNYQFIKSTKDDIQMAVVFITVITPLNIFFFSKQPVVTSGRNSNSSKIL